MGGGARPPADAARGWLGACARFVAAEGLDPAVLSLLRAYGSDEADLTEVSEVSEVTFPELEAAALAEAADQRARVQARLEGEVDPDQAALFARRLGAVCELLEALSPEGPAARVLRVGLWRRIDDILAAPGPWALRVRACVDFYFSHAALLRHAATAAPVALESLLAEVAWRPLAPGLAHARVVGPTPSGPVHLNLLRLRPGCRLEAAQTAEVGDFAAWVRSRGAPAATSGGFFLYSEADIRPPSRRRDPVGLLVVAGEVRVPPVFRRSALVQGRGGPVRIAQIGPEQARLHLADGRRLRPVRGGEAGPGELPVRAVNRAEAEAVDTGAARGLAVVAHRVVAAGQGRLAVPLNGLVLLLPPGEAAPPVGSELRWVLDEDLHTAMAGGPRLLRHGEVELDLLREDFAGSAPPVTFSRDETFDQNLLPRLVAGLDPEGTVFFAAIDGRNLDRAPGFTLRRAARLLAALGCTEALNLDGGSSKRMVVAGEQVDLASTEVISGGGGAARVRPVNTALLAFPAGD